MRHCVVVVPLAASGKVAVSCEVVSCEVAASGVVVSTLLCEPNRILKLQSGFLHANTQWILDTTRDSRLISEAIIAST